MSALITKYSLPDEVRARWADSDDDLLELDVIARRGVVLGEQRRAPIERRVDEDGNAAFVGYATTWGTWYNVAGGPPYGFREMIEAGSADKSLQMRTDKIAFLFDHEGIPLARNTSGTMTLTADSTGLHVDVPEPDVARNVFAAAVASAIERGDVDEMSFAFRAIRQEWNDDYTERRVLEMQLFDVSAVTYPANSATIIGMRNAARSVDEIPVIVGLPLGLALAQAQMLASA